MTMPLVVAPNGNIFFRSDWVSPHRYNYPTVRLRVYRADLNPPRIESISFSGAGVPGDDFQDLSACSSVHYGLGFSSLGELNISGFGESGY
ncbi:MAG: hypothetical protein HC902_04990 [Calothrix sp. SM1_5_4]|nr:hypothetical protein [Calothrix sp. SM1_5_4]